MEHPFKKIYAKANSCNINNIPDFPVLVDVELTNKCNLKCTMCPGQNTKMERGELRWEIFAKIVEEQNRHKTPMRFVRWGEPTMNEFMYAFTSIERDFLIHVNTNGVIEERYGLSFADSVKFSMQGVDKESYTKVRGDHWNTVIKNITELYNTPNRPYIEIGTTTEGEDATEFIEQMSKISDKVSVGRTYHVGGDNSDLTPMTKCSEVYSKLSVNWDGTVSACCRDWDAKMIVGDLHEQTLQEIWNSDKLKQVRETLSRTNKPCSSCYIYTEMGE